MRRQQIRPSLADLTSDSFDYDSPAFPGYDADEPPAVTVSRKAPPSISTSSDSNSACSSLTKRVAD